MSVYVSGGHVLASGGAALATSVFPVGLSSDSRSLVQANGTPFPVLGRALWAILSIGVSAYQTVIQDTVSKGYNSIEMSLLIHWPEANNAPFDGNGDVPFNHTLSGATWTGALTYSNINTDAPDFTTPNSNYWSFVDGFIDYCAANKILIFAFPSYLGFGGGDQGWMAEMSANGTTNMQTYGAFLASRYANRSNIVWMAGGDFGTGGNPLSGPQTLIEAALLTGLGTSKFLSAEWNTDSIATDQTTFGSQMTLNGAYSFGGSVNFEGLRAYAYSPTLPAFLLEEPYDQEGPDGTDVNPSATQPCVRFPVWGHLSTIGGYIAGNGYVWPFLSGYTSHLTTQTQSDESRWNAFILSINTQWPRLVPSGQGSIGTLITSGAGSQDQTNMVTAACTPLGDLWIAYAGPGWAGSFTVDMTKMRGTITARWWDITAGTYTAIGTFPNTGTQTFNTIGNNSAGRADWVLRLDA